MPLRLTSAWSEILGSLRPNRAIQEFAKFLQVNSLKTNRTSKGVVLVIVNRIQSHHVGISQAAPQFAADHSARLVAFYSSFAHGNAVSAAVGSLRQLIARYSSSGVEAIYKGFGVQKFLTPRISKRELAKVRDSVRTLKQEIGSPQLFERMSFRGVLIGDLIYDQYLLESKQVSLFLDDPRLWRVTEQALELLTYFEQYFERREVKGVFGNNAYLNAIPNRVALARGIPVYEASIGVDRVAPVDSPNYFAVFRSEFRAIDKSRISETYGQAQQYLYDFVSGEKVAPLFGHTFASFAGKTESTKLNNLGHKTRVLVAPHNTFTDSPHAIGFSLFPDYGAWLSFLAELSEKTDYEWLIKIHPDRRDEEIYALNRKWITEFVENHGRFRLVPESTPHSELISKGVDAVLTVSGSIGFEYAACGIPVINACVSNPHAGYNFNISPKSVAEYERVVRDIPNLRFNIDLEEVAEFFFMRMIESAKSPFFEDVNKLSETQGGALNFQTDQLYAAFIEEYNSERNLLMRKSLSNFFRSGDLHWYERHASMLTPE